jgi:hypothetical protein
LVDPKISYSGVVIMDRFICIIPILNNMVDYGRLNEELKEKGLDFDRMTDRIGYPIEPQIKPLLYVLNIRGYETTASCEGHPMEEFKRRAIREENLDIITVLEDTPYSLVIRKDHSKRDPTSLAPVTYHIFNMSPWADVELTNDKASRLEDTINSYNNLGGVQWRLEDHGNDDDKVRLRIEVEPQYPLVEMQQDISRIAEYFYNNL